MGSWGVGLRNNDDAGDAIDLLQGGEASLPSNKIEKLLRRADQLAGTQGVLGLAEELLEQGADLRPLKKILARHIAWELNDEILAAWHSEAESRRKALRAFAQRIGLPPMKPKNLSNQPFNSKKPDRSSSVTEKGENPIGVKPSSEKKRTSEGLRPISKKGKWGYVDPKGAVVIPLQYDDADPFEQGVARIAIGEGLDRRYGLIDSKGRMILKSLHSALGQFSDGLARIEINGKEGYIDRTGKVVIKPLWDQACPFQQGRAIVVKAGRYGFIDTHGKSVTGLLFEMAADFVDGMARVRQKGRWGFINMNGKLAIAPQFVEAWDFHKGRAGVTVKEGKKLRSGQIDRTGVVVAWDSEGRFPIRDK